MAAIAEHSGRMMRTDRLTGSDRADGLDRWIFVLMAAFYIVIVLTGFIPDSLMKIAMVQAGQRPPFPPILHAHAVVMGSFLLTLLAQTWLAATGRMALHQRLGKLGAVLAVALIAVGFVLVPTMYHEVWDGLQHAPPEFRTQLGERNLFQDNILLAQTAAGLSFAYCIIIGLRARGGDVGLHKRMMIIAPAMALGAAFARIHWLPSTLPSAPTSNLLYQLLALSPLFLWDVYRNRFVHRAWWILLGAYLPIALIVGYVWDKPWWHQTARWIMGV